MSVTGSASITLVNQDNHDVGNTFSSGDSINFSGSGELDNGFIVTSNVELDGGTYDDRSISVEIPEAGTIEYKQSASTAYGSVDDVTPTAYGESWDIISGSLDNGGATGTSVFGSIGSAGSDNMFQYKSGDLIDGFSFSASYVPSGTGEVESSTDIAVEYTGFDGLTVGYASGENNASGGTNNTDLTTMYVKYAYGPVTVGFQQSDIDSNAATTDDEFEAMGITYQVSDDLTIGYNESTYKDAASTTVDQENSNLSATYTMGGMTLSVAMAEEKNRGGSTAAADDVKGYNINLAFAF